MNYSEAMAVNRLNKLGIGKVLDEIDIKDIEILLDMCCKLTRQINDLLVEEEAIIKIIEEVFDPIIEHNPSFYSIDAEGLKNRIIEKIKDRKENKDV